MEKDNGLTCSICIFAEHYLGILIDGKSTVFTSRAAVNIQWLDKNYKGIHKAGYD